MTSLLETINRIAHCSDEEYRKWQDRHGERVLLSTIFLLLEKLGGTAEIDLMKLMDLLHDKKANITIIDEQFTRKLSIEGGSKLKSKPKDTRESKLMKAEGTLLVLEALSEREFFFINSPLKFNPLSNKYIENLLEGMDSLCLGCAYQLYRDHYPKTPLEAGITAMKIFIHDLKRSYQ